MTTRFFPVSIHTNPRMLYVASSPNDSYPSQLRCLSYEISMQQRGSNLRTVSSLIVFLGDFVQCKI